MGKSLRWDCSNGSRDSLIPIIQGKILEESTLYTDGWMPMIDWSYDHDYVSTQKMHSHEVQWHSGLLQKDDSQNSMGSKFPLAPQRMHV